MFTVVITEKEGAERRLTFAEAEVTVGRVPGNDVVLPKGNVSKRHSRIVRKENRFIVVDLKSTNGTYVNGRKITSPLVVKEGDKIYVGDFVLTLEGDAAGSLPSEAMRSPSLLPSELEGAPGRARNQPGTAAVTLDQANNRLLEDALVSAPDEEDVPVVLRADSRETDEPAEPRITAPNAEGEAPPNTGVGPAEELLAHAARRTKSALASGQVALGIGQAPAIGHEFEPGRPRATIVTPPVALAHTPVHGVNYPEPRATTTDLRTLLSQAALELTRQAQLVSHDETMRRGELERVLSAKVGELIAHGVLGRAVDRGALVEAALRELSGLGPLEALLADTSVGHILIERFDRIFADLGAGLRHQRGLAFSTPESLLLAARRLLAQADVSPPLNASYDVVLPNGLHVVAFLSATTDGPVLSLRRRIVQRVHTEDLLDLTWIDEAQRKALNAAIRQHRNIWVVGPDAQLHARVLAALLGEVADDERIALFERVPEVSFESRSCICLRLLPGNTSELLERSRHARVQRLFLLDVREDELKPVLHAMAKGPSGHVASYECSSLDQGLLQLRRAGGIDVTLRAVGVVVNVVPHPGSGGKVTAVVEVELDDSSELSAKPYVG